MSRNVVITGANGWIGGYVGRKLLGRGYTITGLSRDPESARAKQPDFEWVGVDSDRFDRAVMQSGLVINCAGAHPFERPWDDEYKQIVEDSRADTTARVSAALGYSTAGEKVLVNASGTWFYGECGDDTVTEDRPATNATYLTRMHQRWESAAFDARSSGTRVAVIRIGLGLGLDGGALPFLSEPFKNGQGAYLGGSQWIPWIHVDDLSELFIAALENPAYDGPINGSAPNPARYSEMAEAIAAATGTACEGRVPAEQVRAMFGEASEIILTSCRAVPRKAEAAGFPFRYTDVRSAMRAIFGVLMPA
jgi:uncharacterized protein (TIGR01777 family)